MAVLFYLFKLLVNSLFRSCWPLGPKVIVLPLIELHISTSLLLLLQTNNNNNKKILFSQVRKKKSCEYFN